MLTVGNLKSTGMFEEEEKRNHPNPVTQKQPHLLGICL